MPVAVASRLRGMGKARKHPRATPSPRSLGIAADYTKLLKRKNMDEAAILRSAQLKGIKLTQPTLNRAGNAALERGASDDTLKAIAEVVGETPEQAFPSVFTTGDSLRDHAITIIKRLSGVSLAKAIEALTRLDEEVIRSAGGEPTPRSGARDEAAGLRPALGDAGPKAEAQPAPPPQSHIRQQGSRPHQTLKR